MEEVLRKIRNDKAKEIGQGPWEKDACYLVYEIDGKYYAILMVDLMSCWLEDSTLEEIQESEISDYI